MNGINKIVEDIYTAALDPGAWPQAMRSLQRRFGATSVGLYCADMESGGVTKVHLRDIDPDYVDCYVDHYLKDNPWCVVPPLQAPGRVRTDTSLDEHYARPGYYRSTDLFNEWMKPQNFIFTLGVNLAVERKLQTKLFVYRAERSGPFSRREIAQFERLARHMSRAVQIARRLAVDEAQGGIWLDVIDRLKFGVVLLDENARVVQLNRFADELLSRRDGLSLSQRALVTTHRGDMTKLVETIRAALEVTADSAQTRTATARRASGCRPLSVTAFPLPRRTPHVFGWPRVVAAVVVTDPELDPVVPEDELRRRYSLTAAEARLAQSLTRGTGMRDAAEKAGLSYETARWYLKSTFQKTGTTRQADLVRLLLSDPLLVG
jgi:DNA-binding CsgD family transcriptional regulator